MNVVVANSAPCGACRSCLRGRASLCEDLTYLWGTFAQYVRIPAPIVATNMLERPGGLSADLAPIIEPLACAIHGASRSGAAAGDDVVILGGGVQGQFLTACLAARGCRVTLCDPHPDRRARALRFGAAATCDAPRDEAGVDAVRDALSGRGADVVFEAIGRSDTWQIAVALAARGGEVNLYGGCPQGTTVSVPTEPLHYQELRLQGSYHHTPQAVRDALALVMSGGLPLHELVGEPIQLQDVAGVLATSGAKRPVIV